MRANADSRARRRSGRAILLVAAGVVVGGSGAPHGPRPAPTRVTAAMRDDMRFHPEHVILEPGDTLVWVNEGGLPHTATDSPGKAALAEHNVLPPGAASWDSGLMQPGDTFAVVLDAPGDYTYLCVLHESLGMVGRITVQRASAMPPS